MARSPISKQWSTRLSSLTVRSQLATGLVLFSMLLVAGITFEHTFKESLLQERSERLNAYVYTLLTSAEVDARGKFRISNDLPEPRLATPDSGLYARVLGDKQKEVWRSTSMFNQTLNFGLPSNIGHGEFFEIENAESIKFFSISFAVQWETDTSPRSRYIFQVAESREDFDKRIKLFRQQLFTWLGSIGVAGLIVLGLVLSWCFSPLRKMRQEIKDIEAGKIDLLSRDYPRELRPLSMSLNNLIAVSQKFIARQRNTLGDLSHSLKTPLSVLHASATETQSNQTFKNQVLEQIDRMRKIVEYHLNRASAVGSVAVKNQILLFPTIHRLRRSLDKVYRDKNIVWYIVMDEDITFPGDEGDLLEIMGNVLDNACKWATSKIRVGIEIDADTRSLLTIMVEDDGPGIPDEFSSNLIIRGQRADLATPGHGIGLAVINEIVNEVYHGEILFAKSRWGGASVIISLGLQSAAAEE